MSERPQAVLWDFDGTMVDSSEHWFAAEVEVMRGLGASWTLADSHALEGVNLVDGLTFMLARAGRPELDPTPFVDQLVVAAAASMGRAEPKWRPGVEALLAELRRADLPLGLVTASYAPILDAALAHLPRGTFATVVPGDAVTRGKPHPEPYLTACARLGVDPRRVIVIEDSVTGVAAGRAAGSFVVAINFRSEHADAPGLMVTGSLEAITWSGVEESWRAWA